MGLSLVRFDEQNKLGDACRSTSLEDGGDDSFREPLQILLDICDREARLTLIDRLATKHDATSDDQATVRSCSYNNEANH